jgi:hypothetical protein
MEMTLLTSFNLGRRLGFFLNGTGSLVRVRMTFYHWAAGRHCCIVEESFQVERERERETEGERERERSLGKLLGL